MICPYCQTDNRDDRENCYYCNKDLSMLRLIVNKAKLHYNQGLEFAERGHLDDAIIELKNALDLDASLANAQVVLGTLYAKKEQFAEAREAWQRALALDHRFAKAHEYLNKSEQAEYVFPALHRLKRLSLGLAIGAGALLLLALGLGVVAFNSDDDLKEVVKSATLLEKGGPDQLATVAESMGAVAERHNASDISRSLAKSLGRHAVTMEHVFNAQRQDRITLANNSIGDDPYLSLQILEAIDEKKIHDDAVRQSIRRVKTRATEAINQRIRMYAEQFFAGTMPFELLRGEAQRYLDRVASGPAHDEVAQTLERAGKVQHDRQLAEAKADINQAPLADAPQRIVKWEARSAELGQPLRQILDQRLGAEAARFDNEISARLEQGQILEARQLLADLTRTYETAQRSAPDQLLAALQGRIDQVQRRRDLAAAHDAFTQKQWESFVAATDNIDQLTTDSTERAALTQMRLEARQSFAKEQWDWFQARDRQFSDGSLSAADAGHAAQVWEAVVTDLPETLTYGRATTLYYTAAAFAKLDQPDRSRDLLKRVQQEYPKSAIAKNAAKLLKKLDAAAPATPAANQGAAAAPDQAPGQTPDAGKPAPVPLNPVKKDAAKAS